MKKNDFDAFRTVLSGCLMMWGDAPSAEVTAVWFRCLEGYDLAQVSAAFSAHMRDPHNGKFAPKPAHIIEQINAAVANDGRPGPEEAWALAIRSRDEFESVVWTRECALAWGVAKTVVDLGDEVGARMAFRDSYNRLVEDARRRREPVTWEVSEGFDQERRRLAVAQAVETGRIPASHHLALQAPQGNALLAIEHDGEAGAIPESVRQRLQELRALYVNPPKGPSLDELERARTHELKVREAQKTVAYARARGIPLH